MRGARCTDLQVSAALMLTDPDSAMLLCICASLRDTSACLLLSCSTLRCAASCTGARRDDVFDSPSSCMHYSMHSCKLSCTSRSLLTSLITDEHLLLVLRLDRRLQCRLCFLMLFQFGLPGDEKSLHIHVMCDMPYVKHATFMSCAHLAACCLRTSMSEMRTDQSSGPAMLNGEYGRLSCQRESEALQICHHVCGRLLASRVGFPAPSQADGRCCM
jgi:hypothetical protein